MRAVVLAMALLSTPAMANELKPFDFMTFVAGQPIPPAKLKRCGKGGDVTCTEPLVKVSNVYVGYMLTTHDYRLSTLFIDAHPNSYSALLEAFKLKYGEPCHSTIGVWQNAMGAKLDNPTLMWCFASGKLMFSQYGAQINKMGIFYEDDNQPPKQAPVLNF